MDSHTEGITAIFKGFSSPMATPNEDPVTSVFMQAPVTPLKPTAIKRKLDFDDQLPAKKTQWFGNSSIATAPEVGMNNVCWLSPPQAPVLAQQSQIFNPLLSHENSRIVANISPVIPSKHTNLYNASGHVIANESSVVCERSLVQNHNNSRTWASDQILGFNTPEELYAVYRNSQEEFNLVHGREYMADSIYGIDNQEFNAGHARYSFPDTVYGNSNAVYGNDWNATYPYISFHACADGFPVRYFQRRDNLNMSELQAMQTVDSSLAPVTPEKNIQNERQWKRQSMSSTDLYSDERVSQEKQDDPLNLSLSTGIGGTEACGDQSPPLLLDSSSVTLQSPGKTNQLVTECENEDDILDLNKTPLPKPKRRKHRPKVIREGRSVKGSRAKNLEQTRAKINIPKGKRSSCKRRQLEGAILNKEASQKLQEEKSTLADQIVNVTTSVVRESTGFSEEPPTTQSVEENQQTPETQHMELQIQPDGLELAGKLAARQAALTPALQKEVLASPEIKMSAPQQEVLVSSENKVSGMIGNLSQSPSIASPVKRKPFRENVKMLARKKEKLIATEKGNLKRNNGLKLQTFPGGVQPENLSIAKRRNKQHKDKSKKNNGVMLQTFPGGVQPDNFSQGKRKKKQARELVSKPDNSLCTVSPTLEHKHGVGDQTDTAIVGCESLPEFQTNCYAPTYPRWNTCVQSRRPPPHRVMWPGVQDSIHDSQSSNNLQEPATLSCSPQAEPSFMDPVDAIIQKLKQLELDEKDVCSVYKGLEMVPSEGNGELVPYIGNRDMVPYEGPFDPLKKRKARPRVELDAETNRVWRLLMGKASNDDKQPTDEEERERRWEEERKIFRGRVDSFIARMHLVQGDRRFSQWKGSVVDSVVGAFLTQNVSDHLSSSAFISLASRFPPDENSGDATADPDELGRAGLEENTLAEDATEMAQIAGQALTEHIPGHHTVNLKMDEQCMGNPRGMANSGESSASNLLGEKGDFTQRMGLADVMTNEPMCHDAIYDHRLCIPDRMDTRCGILVQDQPLPSAHIHVTREHASVTPINQCPDRCGSSSESNSEAGEQTNESTWKKTHSFTKLHSFTELLRKVESGKFWNLEETSKSFRTSGYNDTTSESAQFLDAEYANRKAELNEFDVSNVTQSVICDSTDDHNCASIAVNNVHPQNQELRQPAMDMTTLLARQGINTELSEVQRTGEAGNKSRTYAEDLNHDDTQAKDSIGMAEECEKSVQEEAIILPESSEVATVHTNFEEQHASLCMRTGSSLEAEINAACINRYYGIEPERVPAPSSELHNRSEICSEALKDHIVDFLGRSSQEENHPYKVPSTQDSSLTEDGIHAAATLWSLAQQGNPMLHPDSLNALNARATEAPELAQCSNLVDCHTHKDMELEAPKVHFEGGKSRARKASIGRISGVARANIEMSQGGNKQMFDWESIRKKASKFQYGCSEGKSERDPNTKDALNWEAVRCAEVEAIADTIRERGMNNILAGRIKAFLERLHIQHGSIDLEWLKDLPPDDAKDFLLSIRGLGLKSVECIRLLALQHLAFPVDTNVGRICVRLGWVPLQPLPESLQLHLLELYPVLESIQKYLWPRLCTLDQRTLYELHYQMITFGKVFCTKSRPNCNACPMRGDCKHFASAFASARLALPGPTDESSSVANPLLTLPSRQNISTLSPPLALPPTHQELTTTNPFDVLPLQLLESNHQEDKCEPIIEEPATPEHECMESSESAVDESAYTDPDEIPVIHLNFDELSLQLQRICESSMQDLEDTSTGTMSKALVTLSPEAASIPVPKLKNVSRLRTEHRVYELPDHHPLLREFETREADDPCSYLLAIWTPGETSDSIEAPEQCCSSQASDDHPCEQESCSTCMNKRTVNDQTVKGTLLIPCRTAMRGSFPLNGTYFQVNEVFADHETSLNPLEVPRSWIWNLVRRTVYFGTSIPTIFRGLTTEAIQYCFWKGYVCVRGFERNVRAPRPLVARLHFPASKQIRSQKRPPREKIVKQV